VRRLVEGLNNQVAGVCGELILSPPEKGHNIDHGYWSIERRLKAAESSIGGLIGANGGVYAIRKECYQPLKPDTICDDFVIAMNIAVARQGLIYISSAIAFEDTPNDVLDEYHRRVRIGIGNYQALFRHPQYLLSGPMPLRFTYLSHKVLRWLTPHLLLTAFICSAILAVDYWQYRWLAILQLASFAGAVLVFLTRNSIPWPKIVISGMFFAVINWAFLVGFKKYLSEHCDSH
jgi:cellulose synthase/poly-beta-1,6-N-acetylglucosamine synthase-like glycosyltransferase